MDGSRRAPGVLAIASLAVASLICLAACGSSGDDPAKVAVDVMGAIASSDCKRVHKLYPTAGEGSQYPVEGCSNEIDGSRVVGDYGCIPDGEQTGAKTTYKCVSADDSSTYFSVYLEKATDGWIVTDVLGVPV